MIQGGVTMLKRMVGDTATITPISKVDLARLPLLLPAGKL